MKIKFNIIGLDCPNCAAKLASQIEAAEGISSAKINFLTEKLTVETELDEVTTYDVIFKFCQAFDDDLKLEK